MKIRNFLLTAIPVVAGSSILLVASPASADTCFQDAVTAEIACDFDHTELDSTLFSPDGGEEFFVPAADENLFVSDGGEEFLVPAADENLIALDPAQGTSGPIYDQDWATATMDARATDGAQMPLDGPFEDMGLNGMLRGLSTPVGGMGAGAQLLNTDILKETAQEITEPDLPQPQYDTSDWE